MWITLSFRVTSGACPTPLLLSDIDPKFPNIESYSLDIHLLDDGGVDVVAFFVQRGLAP